MSAFNQYFQNIYGERWEKIKKALLEEPLQVLYKNPFLQKTPPRLQAFEKFLLPYFSTGLKADSPTDRIWLKKPTESFMPERDEEN